MPPLFWLAAHVSSNSPLFWLAAHVSSNSCLFWRTAHVSSNFPFQPSSPYFHLCFTWQMFLKYVLTQFCLCWMCFWLRTTIDQTKQNYTNTILKCNKIQYNFTQKKYDTNALPKCNKSRRRQFPASKQEKAKSVHFCHVAVLSTRVVPHDARPTALPWRNALRARRHPVSLGKSGLVCLPPAASIFLSHPRPSAAGGWEEFGIFGFDYVCLPQRLSVTAWVELRMKKHVAVQHEAPQARRMHTGRTHLMSPDTASRRWTRTMFVCVGETRPSGFVLTSQKVFH